MPVTNINKWEDPRLKPLPKYIHGEFANLYRRERLIKKKIDELKAIQDTEIDTEQFYVTNAEDRVFSKWLKLKQDQGKISFKDVAGGKQITAMAYQSCWPEESSTMIFQYMRDILNVRFKWWGVAILIDDEGSTSHEHLSLIRRKTMMKNECLPNINACRFACPGDYGDKFAFGSKTSRVSEFINYISSPNIRENRSITEKYTQLAISNQYSDVRIKRGAEEEVTTIAKLWIEVLETDSIKSLEARRSICAECLGNKMNSTIKLPNGEMALRRISHLFTTFNGNFKAVKETMKVLPEEAFTAISTEVNISRQCNYCIFDKNQSIEEKHETYDFIKDQFDKESAN